MDTLALEASSPKNNGGPGPAQGAAPSKRKPAKKTKKAVVFFEVEILDVKTKDKLCFLDKVRPCVWCVCGVCGVCVWCVWCGVCVWGGSCGG